LVRFSETPCVLRMPLLLLPILRQINTVIFVICLPNCVFTLNLNRKCSYISLL
jgi:hypothetical protein